MKTYDCIAEVTKVQKSIFFKSSVLNTVRVKGSLLSERTLFRMLFFYWVILYLRIFPSLGNRCYVTHIKNFGLKILDLCKHICLSIVFTCPILFCILVFLPLICEICRVWSIFIERKPVLRYIWYLNFIPIPEIHTLNIDSIDSYSSSIVWI